MAIADRIKTYSASVFHNDLLNFDRQIRLKLESGATAMIGFPEQRPNDWLQFVGGNINLYLTAADYDDVLHLLQSECSVFLTALNLIGLRAGAIHTELDLAAGEHPGEDAEVPRSLEALIRRANAQLSPPAPGARGSRSRVKRRRSR